MPYQEDSQYLHEMEKQYKQFWIHDVFFVKSQKTLVMQIRIIPMKDKEIVKRTRKLAWVLHLILVIKISQNKIQLPLCNICISIQL